MIKYLFLQSTLSIIFFMTWVYTTNLPGGEVGMAPFLLGILLLIQLGAGIVLSLIFRTRLETVNSKLVGILIYLVIYELGQKGMGSEPMILGIFDSDTDGETNRAFSLIPLISGGLTLMTISISERKTTT